MRRGVTIIEVLFAILIVTIGIFGSIAVFVYAGSNVKKSVILDSAAVIGRSSVHDFDVRGMRRPERWHTWTGTHFAPIFDTSTKQFATGFSPVQSYCIDSRFATTNALNWSVAGTFPYSSAANAPGPRMHRVAFLNSPLFVPQNATQAQQMLFGHKAMADVIFQCQDDLTYLQEKDDRSLPASQVFTKDPDGKPGRRLSDGRFSWMATLFPKPEGGVLPNGNPGWVGGDHFILSIVVFHDRDLGIDTHNERTLGVVVQGDGATGGEVMLTSTDQEALKIKDDSWLLLSGMKPYRVIPTGPVMDTFAYFRWYKVTHVDDAPEQVTGGYRIFATLMGQDWGDAVGLISPQAVAVENVVSVYEKTVRLDYGSTF